tara:strand:- start:3262 stop:3678 length:417 start_codon:yes stop_codon:yes gene_type:complete
MNQKVLIVDDEESILKGIKLNLGRSLDISVAHGPEQALDEVNESGPFAVVVSDMRMPGMDGASLMRQIKKENPETSCILLTGHADFEFGGSEALQSGQLFKILNKPCHPSALKNAILSALDAQLQEVSGEEHAPDMIA